jgi:ATP-dependent DNA helicase RecQ
VAVVGVPSATRPELTLDLARRLAQIGRLRFLGTLESADVPPRRANSAQRLADLSNRLRLPEELASAVSTVNGPILLVDDLVDTGWTVTVAARLLRQAGAPAVLPFALASTS